MSSVARAIERRLRVGAWFAGSSASEARYAAVSSPKPAPRAIVAPLGLDRARARPARSRGPRAGRARASSSAGSGCGTARRRSGADQMPFSAPGRGEVVALERLEERGVGRVDLVPDDVANRLAILVARHRDERRHDGLLDRRREHPLELGDRPLGDDARRGQAAGAAPRAGARCCRPCTSGRRGGGRGTARAARACPPAGTGTAAAAAAAGRPSGRRPGGCRSAGRPGR